MEKIIRIPPPHKLQAEIEDDPARFKVLAIGRRWGKSDCIVRSAFKGIVTAHLKKKRKARGWIVAPTFPMVRENWLKAEEMLKDAITAKKLTEMRMDFGIFGFLEFKSADRGDTGLRGAGLDWAGLDECARSPREAWEQGVRPALADQEGCAVFGSTPKGRNWFWEIYQKGVNGQEGFKSWKYPTHTNPYFPGSEWETIKKSTPEMILKQEYEADFLEDEATVFKNIDKCYRGDFELYRKGETYTVGVDLAKTHDFTVISVIRNSTAQLVDLMRFNQIDWSVQKQHIKQFAVKFPNSMFVIDSTGVGDPIEEDLRKSGISTTNFKFTNSNKQELVECLVVAIEQGLIGIPVRIETQFLIDELKSFSYESLPSGRIRYSAPSGLHDDGVMSLGLAVRQIQHLLREKKEQVVIEKPKGMTADQMMRMYDELDMINKKYPGMSKDQQRLRVNLNRLRRNTIRLN